MLNKEKVFILKKVKYGDADLILQCLTTQGSRLSLFARAALKSRKRFGGGVLEPTHYVQVMYENKKNGAHEDRLANLKEASLLQAFSGIRTDYTRLETALHFVSLVADTTREGMLDTPELFNLLGNSLRAAETSQQLGHLRTHFEAKLLAQHGVLPQHAEEECLLQFDISKHESITLADPDWRLVRARIRSVLNEFLGRDFARAFSQT